MPNNDQNDKELNDYLNGNSDVSKAYRASNKTKPSSHLDNAILAAAKEAVLDNKQKTKTVFHKAPWVKPISIAAMITLSVSLVVTMQQESGQPLISEPEIEMFGGAALIEEVVMPQIISADRVVNPELKAKKNNEKDMYDDVPSEAALGAVGGYRAPVNPPDRVKIEVMKRRSRDKNKSVDEARASAPAALDAAADIYRAEEKAEAPKAIMRERAAKKVLSKEKAQIQTETEEKNTFAGGRASPSAAAEMKFDDVVDREQERHITPKEDILLKIKAMWEQGELVSAKEAYEEFTRNNPDYSSENIKEILGDNIYNGLLGL
jgi:hypothetical protein